MAELKVYRELEDYVGYDDAPMEMYGKDEADTVIAELEETARQERSAKVEYKESANNLSDRLAEAYRENRELKRALWLVRAKRAMAESYTVLNDVLTSNRWIKALNKLNAKAEEYK